VRIAFFTPASQQSAIGRVSKLVVHALRDHGHEVDVVRAEDVSQLDSPAHPFGAPLFAWNDEAAMSELNAKCDAFVYQVGNNFPYHCGCLEWMPRRPGIVCLHDYFVGNLFYAWADRVGGQAANVVRAWYGDEVASHYFSYRGEQFLDETYDKAPMTEWIAAQALAVLTHSSWGVDRVLAACPGPVLVVPLAYEAPQAFEEPTPPPADTFRILTVGHVNPNKRAESVIAALSMSELRRCSLYQIVGLVEPSMARKLRGLANEQGVAVDIAGEVDDEALGLAIRNADVIACLRYPTLEAASASTIEAMLSGKAVLVTDAGFYSELPSDCVRKISPAREVADLRRELESLYADREQRAALGKRAQAWARKTFTAANYADSLVSLCQRAARAAPLVQASASFARTLVGWGATRRAADWIADAVRST
jgi:glycosyltransferase involved in cell wall biosynthesis